MNVMNEQNEANAPRTGFFICLSGLTGQPYHNAPAHSVRETTRIGGGSIPARQLNLPRQVNETVTAQPQILAASKSKISYVVLPVMSRMVKRSPSFRRG